MAQADIYTFPEQRLGRKRRTLHRKFVRTHCFTMEHLQSTKIPQKKKRRNSSGSVEEENAAAADDASAKKIARREGDAPNKLLSTQIKYTPRHTVWCEKLALAVLLGSRNKHALRFPVVRQRIGAFLLEVGMQKEYLAYVAVGNAWPSLARWPTDPRCLHWPRMSNWTGARVMRWDGRRMVGERLVGFIAEGMTGR